MEPYRDSIDHLTDELKRLDLLVRRALIIARTDQPRAGGAEFRGLVISEQEIDDLLESGEFFLHHWHRQDDALEALDPIDQKIQGLRQAIDQRKDETARSGRRLTLPHLADRFGLSAAETDLLVIAIAPELEPRYETLYAYLQDDVTRKRPSVDLALNLIARRSREKLFARRIFAPGAPLVHFRMIEILEESYDRQPTLLRKFMKVEDSLLRYLLEQPPTVLTAGTFVTPSVTLDSVDVDEETRSTLSNLVDALGRSGMSNAIVRLVGSSRPELEAAAEAIAHALDRTLLTIEASDLEGASAHLHVMFRDAALLDAALTVFATDATPGQRLIWKALDEIPGPVIAAGPVNAFADLPRHASIWKVDVTAPDYEQRQKAWDAALTAPAADVDTARLAESFLFSGSEIRQTSALASSLAALRNPSDPSPSMTDVLAAGRSLGTPTLNRFAVSIEPRYEWADIVLPEEKLRQLRHIATRYQHRRTVHSEWGFGAKLSRGKGLNVLFTGPSGVGKTMAAEVLANALSLVLFQIDLSSVVSKYIGETEKNLSVIFREAAAIQCLLFFDEADSLFSKRTEVKDAHDRYANLEVNYLLQRIEQYEGVVVLATNMQRNLDDAFVRRIQEAIDFPFPDEELRKRIWLRHLPDAAPLEDGLDFDFLARQFKLTGGTIKNAVMTAAFLAADKHKKIGMSELIAAVKRELQKEGKLVMKTDFGKYFDLTQEASSSKPV